VVGSGVEMVVDLYSIAHGYGFCQHGEKRFFFRVEDFLRGPDDPLPICGERVHVGRVVQGRKSPRAMSLTRINKPTRLAGRVRSFDSGKGWGFIDHEGEDFFLHLSDLMVSFIPVIGSQVTFYAGIRRGKPRSCYVLPNKG
jgi:cold shock CspA family protein